MGRRTAGAGLAAVTLIAAAFVPVAVSAVSAPPASAKTTAAVFPDFNHDGFADTVVSIDQQDIGTAIDAGAIEVLYGNPFITGVVAHHQYISNQDTVLKGSPITGGRFGENTAAGDFNGDGYDDLAIGEYGATVDTAAGAGQVHILYGSASGLTDAKYQNVNQNTAGVQDTAEAGDQFGHSVAAGDLNHDGFEDLVVSVPREDLNGETQVGAAHVFFGSATGLQFAATQGALYFHQGAGGGGIGDAAEHNDIFGSPVAIGDFDHDGFGDIAIGVQGESLGDVGTPGPQAIAGAGGFHVLYGNATKASVGARHQFFTENSAGMPDHATAADRFGAYFAAGDFNGDGYPDLAVGADGKTVTGVANAGAAYVFKGSASGITTSGSQLWDFATPGVLGDPVSGDNFGDCLAAGDFNHDGKTDLAITVDRRTLNGVAGTWHGMVLVYPGSASLLTLTGAKSFNENTPGIAGFGAPASGDQFGSIAKTSDFNGDHYADLYIAAGGKAVSSQAHAGALYLLKGSASGVSVSGAKFYTQNTPGIEGSAQANAWFGGT
ncbi:MAG: repeat protein [Actinomycetia bacterium]|nr:repeat protein [Actinomycetes bacterium]